MKKYNFKAIFVRYKVYIYIGLCICIGFVIAAQIIFAYLAEGSDCAWFKFAEFLMSVGEAILTAGIIGGGIGGGINFIVEEMKKEEEEIKERQEKQYEEEKERREKEEQERKERQVNELEQRQNSRRYRRSIRQSLGQVHDNVGLARILIKSHKSGKTYGGQIRGSIMPSLISLQDIRRDLTHLEQTKLVSDLPELRVSLNYMIAYLSVLTREFETNYLTISNLQNYQDAMDDRMQNIFTGLVTESGAGKKDGGDNQGIINHAAIFFEKTDVPEKINVVWQEIQKLYYVTDFIDELRNEEGDESRYSHFFLKYYNHCIKILRSSRSSTSEQLVTDSEFIANMEELKRIDEKQKSKYQLTNQDFLTWRMMELEMEFDIKSGRRKAAE